MINIKVLEKKTETSKTPEKEVNERKPRVISNFFDVSSSSESV